MVVEYNTEKKHTEYKIIVEDGRVSKIIVKIPKDDIKKYFKKYVENE